ncbi:MAG: FG-GAP repeat protein [Granulosicoccus sp.]
MWRLEQKILAPDAAEDDNFGESVALDGDIALIRAIRDDELGIRSGSAHVSTRTILSSTDDVEQRQVSSGSGSRVAVDSNCVILFRTWLGPGRSSLIDISQTHWSG